MTCLAKLTPQLLAHSAQGFLIENSLTSVEFGGGQGVAGVLTVEDHGVRRACQRFGEQVAVARMAW
ncbi:MAG: hypothetical protein ABIT83_24670 [Massilia sp.]